MASEHPEQDFRDCHEEFAGEGVVGPDFSRLIFNNPAVLLVADALEGVLALTMRLEGLTLVLA